MGRVADLLMLRKAAWDVRPRLPLALKAALAAGVSYQLALLFPSPIDDYAYYAPLGAVLALFPTVASSLQGALQTFLGIVLGASIAVLVDMLPVSTNGLSIAVVIGLGILVGVVPWLGGQRSWVPITALFVYAIGSLGSSSYVVAYVVLTLVGAVIGTLVNFLVFPPLYLRQSRTASAALLDVVTDQMQALAEGLERNETPNRDDWEQRTRALSPTVLTMRQAVYDMDQSTRGNPRARKYREVAQREERLSQALRRMALLVEDLTSVLAEVEQSDVPALPFNEKARLQGADVLRRLSDLARATARGEDTEEATAAAYQAVEKFETTVAEDPRAGGSDPFVAGTVVTTLRRCLGALVTCGGPPAIAMNRSRLFR